MRSTVWWEATIGLGDQIIGTGLARGAADRQKRIAFGDGKKIIWDKHSEMIFRNNPNIAPPGVERLDPGLEWIPYYKGHRLYNETTPDRKFWIWNRSFNPRPGEFFFSRREKSNAARYHSGFIVIEPNVEAKDVTSNKDWGRDRYQEVVRQLPSQRFVQFQYDRGAPPLDGVTPIGTKDFRDAAAILANAALYVGPEGGLHHAAAAVSVPGVVLFGGFIPPETTGYPTHTNLTGGAEACGSRTPCAHCRAALDAISVDEVVAAARRHLRD